MMKPIRIGVVGLKFGHFHVQTLVNMKDVQLVAVADRSTQLDGGLEAYAARYGAKGYRDAQDMIAQEELDAISICTSPRSRAAIIEAAARQGISMFIEKPWATNLDQATSLAELCEQHQAKVMVGFSFRYHPVVTQLKQLMLDQLGAGWLLNGKYLFAWIPESSHWLWDSDNGGGFFNENSCHLFDVVCHLMGKPSSVYAEAVNYHNSPSAEGASVIIGFENGTSASLMIGGLGTGAFSDYPRINIITEQGQATLQGTEHYWQSLTWAKRSDLGLHTITQSPESLAQTRYTHALQHFVDCIRDNAPFSATIADGIQSVVIAQGIYHSLKTDQKIKLEDL